MKGISLKGRLSKKRILIAVAVLVLSGGAGGYVLQSGLLSHAEVAAEDVQPSGVACTTADFIKLNRGGQRWLRKYVRTDNVDGIERIRTALRIAGVLAQSEKADLYQIVVLDRAGPEGRANLRGAAIGAEVLFAPDPTKLPDMDQPFIARYADGKANAAGLFYGERKALSPDEIRTTLTAITGRADCETLVADASAPVEGDTVGGHGKTPAEQGESAHEGHGAPSEGHGEAGEGHDAPSEGHGEAAEGHDAPAAGGEAGHGASPAESAGSAVDGSPVPAATGGWFSTVTAWIPGMGGEAKPSDGAHAEVTERAKDGMLSTVMRLIPGLGDGKAEAPVAGADPVPVTPEHGSPGHGSNEQAVTVPEAGHETDAAASEGHSPAAGDATVASKAPVQDPTESGHAASADPEGHGAGAADAAQAPIAAEAGHEAAVPHGVTTEETGATH